MDFEDVKLIARILTLTDSVRKFKLLWVTRGFKKISTERLARYWQKRIENYPTVKLVAEEFLREIKLAQAGKTEPVQQILNINDFKQYTEDELKKLQHDNICYIVTCYNEIEFVRQCVASIRRNDCGPIIIINDGGDIEGLEDVALKHNATLIQSKQYKNILDGWKWWDRFFNEGLKTGCDYIVKIDPDSFFWRPLREPIGAKNYFGSMHSEWSVQGGAQGFSKEYAKRIIDTDILKNLGTNGNRENGTFATDRAIAWVSRELNQPAEPWNEVYSVWGLIQKLKLENVFEYAITHPNQLITDITKIERNRPSKSVPPDESRIKAKNHKMIEIKEVKPSKIKGIQICNKHAQRVTICSKCEFYNRLGNCSASNKYVYALSKIESTVCPLNKW